MNEKGLQREMSLDVLSKTWLSAIKQTSETNETSLDDILADDMLGLKA
jgi:hypothetical protein